MKPENFVLQFYIMSQILDSIIESFAECLTRESAERIVGIRASVETQKRLDELASKANQGVLNTDEKLEYDRCLAAFHFVTLMQLRARRVLSS